MGLKIDYDKIDPRFKRTVESIESKPHVRYIRYLLSKRYSPVVVKKELQRLGLSAPHEPQLTAYYLSVIDPIMKIQNVSPLYADYKSKLLKTHKRGRGEFAKDILNYRINICDDLDLQVKFCKMIRALDIDDLWISEIYKFHGSAGNLPIDETGTRILEASSTYRNVDKVLLSPKRYLIDKLILENVPDTRITKYCRENLKININDYDIASYKRAFFNIKTQSIEERIKSLEVEKNSLESLLKDINELEEYSDLEIGEKMLIIKQTEQRLSETSENIKTMNMMYSDFAFKVATSDQRDFEKMFSDVTLRAYARFTQLDGYKDRDVVDPLFKTAKMMSFAHDKVEAIKLVNGSTSGNVVNGDRHSQSVLMDLYKKRLDEVAQEQIERANKELTENADGEYPGISLDIDPNEIAGIEELGLSIEMEESKDK